MAITQKFAYAASYSHYKAAIKSDSTKFDDSIVFTGDGYIVSRGNVIKGTVIDNTNKTISTDYGLKFTASSRTLEFIDENGTSIKSVTLPNIEDDGKGYVTVSHDTTNNKYTVAHKTYTSSSISGSTSDDSITVVKSITVDNGHVSSSASGTVDINKVKHTAAGETEALRVLVAPTATTGTNTKTETLKSTPVIITGKGAISGVTTLETSGNITENGFILANKYAAKQTATAKSGSTAAVEGTVKLIDEYSTKGDDYGKAGYAASSKAVYDAYTDLKKTIEKSFSDLDTSIGNYTGAFQFGGTVTTAAELNEKEKKTGAVYIANGDFDITTNLALGLTKETVESGDMIICDKEGKWLVVQRNITGAVTASSAFTSSAALIGNNGEGRGVKQINIETTHFGIADNKLSLYAVNTSDGENLTANGWIQSTSAGGSITVPSFKVDTYGRVKELKPQTYTIQPQYSLPSASTTIGGIALFDATAKSLASNETPSTTISTTITGRSYALVKDSANKAFVQIPWIEAAAGDGLAKSDNDTTKVRTLSVKAADKSINVSSSGVKVNAGDNLEIDSTALRVKTAQTSVTGAVKVTAVNSSVEFKGETTAPSAAPQESIKCYGLQLDKNGVAFVNVPWTDSQTLSQTVSAKNSSTTSNTGASVTHSLTGGGSQTFSITGSGSAKVTVSDSVINISADINTWRDIQAYTCTSTSIGQQLSQTAESVGTAPLKFSRDFCWHDNEVTICWAEIDSTGQVTYK